MEITFKPLNNHYSEALVELILNIQQNEFNIPITIQDQPDLLSIESVYFSGGGHFWGAFADEELVGSIALIKFEAKAGAIRKMFVKQQFRGKSLGIAQHLLEILLTFSHHAGIESLYLGTVSTLHAAMRFYERNQFEQIDRSSLPARFPVMGADDTFYTRNLIKV